MEYRTQDPPHLVAIQVASQHQPHQLQCCIAWPRPWNLCNICLLAPLKMAVHVDTRAQYMMHVLSLALGWLISCPGVARPGAVTSQVLAKEPAKPSMLWRPKEEVFRSLSTSCKFVDGFKTAAADVAARKRPLSTISMHCTYQYAQGQLLILAQEA